MVVLQSVKGYKLFYCKTNDDGRRLDRVIKKMLPDIPAGLIYSAIRKGSIKVNNKKSSQSYRIMENDVIAVRETIHSDEKKDVQSQTLPNASAALDKITVLRTSDLIFINKPAGMLTHGPDSLAELLVSGLSGVEESLSFIPAPLHRLDRNTTGLIAASVSLKGATAFSELMQNRLIRKYYIGICLNGPARRLRLENKLIRKDNKTHSVKTEGGSEKNALTTVEPLITKDNFTLCLFNIETGITHQIRSQVSAAGFPLAGDNKYGGRTSGFRTFILHSYAVKIDGKGILDSPNEVTAPPPDESLKKISSIFGHRAASELAQLINTRVF
jgi:23S rRNA pseudouridine955/2504/2580 synthase